MPQGMDARDKLVGLRVLLVEDNHLVSEVICEVLAEHGCEILGPAATLGEGLVLAREFEFDGALLDVNLKGGYCFPIAELLIERGVPMLLLTGYTDEATIPAHLRGIRRVDKPVHFNDLIALMRQLFIAAPEGAAVVG